MSMSGRKQPWSFQLTVDEQLRLPALVDRHTFAQITERIMSCVQVLCCHRSKLSDGEFLRPVYTVRIDRPLFDLFFNSPFGYRAAYFKSPGAGLDANVSFLQTIAPRLAADPASLKSALSPDFIHASLSTPSAKVWLAECGKEIDRKCSACEGEWSSGTTGTETRSEILNGRWEVAEGQKAEWGGKAPYLEKLRIMGAFINDRHHELVPHDKRFRAYEIHEFGWS
jgi:hypothetical protein